MKRKITALACAVTLSVCLITGCTGGSTASESAHETLTVFNYSEYLDPEMLELFTEETGIEI